MGEVSVFGRQIPGGADPAATPAGAARSNRAAVVLAVTAAVVLAVDVVSKIVVVAKLTDREPVTLVPHVLDLELTRNPGAAFSIAGGATILFSLVAVAVVVVIARTARNLRSRAWALVFGLLLGGALGNLSDRIFRAPGPLRGHVVDWIHLHHWPVFNVADSAIVVGGVLAVLLTALGAGLEGARPPAAPPGDDRAGGDGAAGDEIAGGGAARRAPGRRPDDRGGSGTG